MNILTFLPMKKNILLSILFSISNIAFAQFPNLVVSSNTPVCQGNTLSLSATHDALSGGTTATYGWSGPNGFTSSVQNPQRPNANVVDGTYTLTLTLSGTQTGTFTATTAVTSRATPLFTAKSYLQNDALNLTSNFCVGNNITLDLDVDYTTGVSYSWTGPNGFSSTLKTPTIANVTAANAGLYQLTGTFNNSACVFTIKRNYDITIGSPRVAITQNLVCAGGNVTLTPVHLPATATVSSYLWEGPNGFTSNVSPLVINNLQDRKTFKLTANFNGACSGTAIAYLSINPIVPAPSVAVSSINCNVNVVASMPTTFAPAELTNYSWTGTGGFTSNLLTAPVMQEGAYTFTGTISGAGCNDVYTKTVVVPRIPATTSPVLGVTFNTLTEIGSSQNAFCDGMNVILLSNRTGDNMNTMTFNWTGPNGFSSTLATPIITNFSAAKAGVYSLTITGTGNACSPTATGTASTSVYIGHNATPSLTGINFLNVNAVGTAFCSGSTVSLNPALNANSSSSIGTYSWTGPNGFSSTQRVPNISNVSAANEGVYNLTATFTSGCVGTATASNTLTLNTLPSFSIAERRLKFNNSVALSNCLGTTVELVAQTGGSIINSISWTGPNGFSSTALSPQIVNTAAANTGYYYATIDFGGECPATITRGSLLTFSNTSNLPFGANLVNTAPTADTRSLCLGNNIRLFPSPLTNNYFEAIYQWKGPNGFTSNDIAPTISNLDASKLGTYTLNATYTTGCVGTATSSVTINTTAPFVSIGIAGNTAVCAGSPLTLTANNITSLDTYSWTGPNGFTSNQSRIHIPSLSTSEIGLYSVTVNIGGSCPTTVGASFNAQFNTTPTTTTISIVDQTTSLFGNAQCAGSNIQLSVPLLTASQITSYSWSGPNGFSSTLSNPTVTNSVAGTYSVTVGYMVCGAISTVTATVALTNTKTVALAARSQGGAIATSFCSGSNIELLVNTITPNYAQPNSYSWAGPNGFSSTAAVPLISNAISSNAGVYTLTVNFANPCGGTVTATTNISITNYQPNLLARRAGQSNAFTFCSGTPIVEFFTSNMPSSGTIGSYSWTGPNGFSSTATSPQIANFQAANAGTYSLTVTVSGGACAGTYMATTSLTVGNASAFISFSGSTNLCPGGGITLFASSNQSYGAGATYSWAGPNNFSSTTANNTLVLSNLQVVNSGVYTSTVNYPSTTGCANSGTGTSTISLTIGVPIATASSRLQGSASSTASFCIGSNVEIFTTFNVTSPAPTVVSYSWTGPNGYSSTSATPLLSNIQTSEAGVYSVTVTFGGACTGTATATRTITVANSTLIALARRTGQSNAYSFCAGTTVELYTSFSPTTPTVSSYSWSGPNGFSSTAALPQIANFQTTNAGTYTLSAVVSGACAGTYTASINLGISNTVSPYIALSGNSVQCPGGNLTLFALTSTGNFSAGSTYSWSGPNNFSSTASTPVLNNLQAVNSGTYTVTVVYPATTGCASFSGTSTMTSKLSIGNTAANILPNQNQTAASGISFPLNIEILGGTLPISMTLSNGSSYTINFTNGNTGNIYTANTSVASAQTISISSISSACGVGTGTGSAVISIGTPCPPSLTNFSGIFNNGAIVYRESSGDITTQTITVNSGGKLTLDSGKAILLQPGFEAKTGSVFKAYIDGCGNITN
jgi:hypothetical protein